MIDNKREQDTKSKIIEAATRVLAEQGYDRASTKEIARQAGVAQGLINYYFSSKDELLFEVTREETQRYCAEMANLRDLPVTDRFISQAMEKTAGLVDAYPDWHRLRFELFAIGLRSDKGKKEIADSLGTGREMTKQLMELLPVNSQVNRDALSAVIVATLDGLSLQKMVDPSFDADAAYEWFGKMLAMFWMGKDPSG